ncbi:MAG: hypothetical protein R3E66_01215 [bacterium]
MNAPKPHIPMRNGVCDLAWITSKTAPPAATGPEVCIADLFSGCSGMTLGAIEGLRAKWL